MSRIPRTHLKTPFFHVMTQGINRNFIFDNPTDIRYYISIMNKLEEEHNISIIAYCIMNNHTHMLIEVENLKELSKYMQRLNSKYAKYYNKKYNRVGYVFRDRYKTEGIYSEEHLHSCIKYIYNNPVKAGICEHPKEYAYSNYKEISSDEEYVFMDVEEDTRKICRDVIKEFLDESNTDIEEIKEQKDKLRELIKLLRNQYDISLRKISEEIKLNRETVRQIYKHKQ